MRSASPTAKYPTGHHQSPLLGIDPWPKPGEGPPAADLRWQPFSAFASFHLSVPNWKQLGQDVEPGLPGGLSSQSEPADNLGFRGRVNKHRFSNSVAPPADFPMIWSTGKLANVISCGVG